jgi:acyl-CoA reductase-like NAD-dependent aldehyde dehydrogenase
MDLNATSEGRVAFTQMEPIGVVLGLAAFNHPFNLVVHQIAPAVAAGAPVIVKPSPKTPLSCRSLVEIFHEAGLPKGFAQMVLPLDIDVIGRMVSTRALDSSASSARLRSAGSSARCWRPARAARSNMAVSHR